MNNYLRTVSVVTALLVTVFTSTTSVLAKAEKTEDELIQEFSNPKGSVVAKAMMDVEKNFPHSAKATPLIKAALTDPRPEVRRKAARVLGVWHEEVSAQDIKNICAMLKAAEPAEVMDALKSLGGLRAKSAVPEILPCLKATHPNVVRDACRALAQIGDKSVIPAIEPLTSSSDKAIKKDAEEAIFKLK
ncbi:MAG: HEAT repeat domain-containing protein [Verrucomicrobiota bacterium]